MKDRARGSTRGIQFESEVAAVLGRLADWFPDQVSVTPQFSSTNALRPYRADFELTYTLGAAKHHHLIECQDRERSSQELADKILSVLATGDRNRFIVVYRDSGYLNGAVRARLDLMGVEHYAINDFTAFIHQLAAQLAHEKIGRTFVTSLSFDQLKHSIDSPTLEAARLFDPKYRPKSQ